MERLTPLPVASGLLEQFRLRLRQTTRANLPGAHLLRRMGQSLEFREFRAYVPGDDIRHVDWRASYRRRLVPVRDYLIRTFEMEAQARILISIDTGESMRLPAAAPKLLLALWVAEALAYIGARSGDRVSVHSLFTPKAGRSVREFGGAATRRQIVRGLANYYEATRAPRELSLHPVTRLLKPGSIWLVISDLYFVRSDDLARLAARIRQAQEGYVWVVLLDLDSWPYERTLLGDGLCRIDGPGVPDPRPHLDVNSPAIAAVEERIEKRKVEFQRAARGGGFDSTRWRWPAAGEPAPTDIFRTHFYADAAIRRILMPDSGER